MYPRYSETLLKELLDEFRILYLTGPRQTGKTTLARKIAKDLGMLYISLDEQTVLASAQSDPHGFIDSFSGKSIILDEFQVVPELIPAIKLVSDQLQPHERGHFFLTGSADIFNSGKT
ncbi:MAG TPA: AAA family ATPase, partial [Arcobacter sp.]|nr:AAA family ATPase [Arcobacter sp.]